MKARRHAITISVALLVVAAGILVALYASGYLDLGGLLPGAAVEPQLYSIGDWVWADENRNGIQDSGERGIAGMKVELYRGQGTKLVAATESDARGFYQFRGLQPGFYSVRFYPPQGFVFSPPNQGDDPARDSDADPKTGLTSTIVVGWDDVVLMEAGDRAAGQRPVPAKDYDAGVCPSEGPPTAVTLAGFMVSPNRGGIQITWETATEMDNVGFNLYRGEQNDFAAASRLNGDLIPSQSPGGMGGAAYSYDDNDAQPGVIYYYWLEDVDTNGTATLHELGEGRWNMPQAVGVSPDSGGQPFKNWQAFAATFRDEDGDMANIYLLVSDSPDTASGVALRYDCEQDRLFLYNEATRQWVTSQGIYPGKNGQAKSSRAALRGSGSRVERDGLQSLTVTWEVKFAKEFRGRHNLYLKAVDLAGNESEWIPAGSWEVK